MNLTQTRWYLAAAATVAGAFFIYINWYGGKDAALDGWWDVTHYTWVSVPQSILLVVPALAFNLLVMRRFGGLGSHVGKAILFLTLGVLSWGVVGNGIFFLYQLANDGEAPPYPWWSDLGYIGLLPMWFLGLFYLSKVIGMRRRDYLRLSWLPVVALALTWYLLLPSGGFGQEWAIDDWSAFSEETTFGPLNFAITTLLYMISDVVVLSWALMLLPRVKDVAGGMFEGPVRLVVASAGFLYLADMFFNQRVAADTYYTGDIVTICYTVSLYLMMAAIYQFGKIERDVSNSLVVPVAMPVTHDSTEVVA